MKIRTLQKQDLSAVSQICVKAFMDSVAPGLSEDGISTFRKIASVEGFIKRLDEDSLALVAEENNQIIGVIELKGGQHLAMLFVDPEVQKKGVGRALMSALLPYIQVDTLTVKASLSSVPAYQNYGFLCSGDADEKAGLKFQPMELKVANHKI